MRQSLPKRASPTRSVSRQFLILALVGGCLLVGLAVETFRGTGTAVPMGTLSAQTAASTVQMHAPAPLPMPSVAAAVVAPGMAASTTDAAVPARAPGSMFALSSEQLQYRMRAVLQDEKLLTHQLQLEAWACQADHCRATIRVPPGSEAGRRQDMGAIEDLMQVMNAEAKAANAALSLRSAVPGRQGIAVELDLTPASGGGGRYYSDDEIAKMRMETVKQMSKPPSSVPRQP